MDDGLIQILVIAVFVIISMMDGAARKRRKQAQNQGLPSDPNRLSEAADDLDQTAESSEGTVPEDLWKEIAALARGEEAGQVSSRIESAFDPPGTGVGSLSGPAGSLSGSETDDLGTSREPGSELEAWDGPQQESPATTRSADLQSGYLHPDQALSHQEHAHERHVEVASPPSPAQPLPAEVPHEFVPHSPKRPSEPKKVPLQAQKRGSLLAGFRNGAKDSMREAIILAEVLSPPVTLRDSGWKPQF